jgi:glycosyltransferase involved in cell wall biosynthesis
LRMALGAAGKAKAELFHWERCAERSIKFFERVCGG